MALRGRGLLEVKKSNNPFFYTTNGEYGIDISQQNSGRSKFNLIPGNSKFEDIKKMILKDDFDYNNFFQCVNCSIY